MNPSVALIGCGKVAHFHADVLKELGVKIQAVCGSSSVSVNAEAFAAKHSIPRIYPNYKALLAEDDANFLWVVTRWDVTETLLTDLLLDGRPVFVEKPVATSSRKLEQILALMEGRSAGRCNLFCGMNRRHYDFIPTFQKLIKNKNDIRMARVTISEQTRVYDTQDRVEAARIQNLWVNSAVHDVDLMLYLLGDLDVIRVYRVMDQDNGWITNVNALLESPGFGYPVFLAANWDSSETKSFMVETSDRTIKLSPLERMAVSAGMVRVPPTETNPIARYVPRVLTEVETAKRFKPGFYNQAQFFLSIVDTDPFSDHCRNSLSQFTKVLTLVERLLGEDGHVQKKQY